MGQFAPNFLAGTFAESNGYSVGGGCYPAFAYLSGGSAPFGATASTIIARKQLMPNVPPSLPPDFSKLAFLLDVDGTIVDLAATPREVYVSHALRDTLRRLLERT